MKILISGAAGFIGQNVLSKLNVKENNILAIDLSYSEYENKEKNLKWIYNDLSNLEEYKFEISKFDPDVVIHLAWQGIPDFSEKLSVLNLNNSINFLDFIIENTHCKKIIVSGSCFEYGEKLGVVKEIDPTQINSYFSWAKNSLYKYLVLKCSLNNVNLIWFRFFYVYGPGQRIGSLIPTLINAFRNNIAPDIRNPYNRNDFVYVKDIANAIESACFISDNINSGIYNLGSGVSTSIYEICRITELLTTGKDSYSKKLLNIQKGEIMDFWADISKTTKAFSWKPEYTIEAGINEILNQT